MSKQYRKASHCVYDLKYHIVWITKYRKPVLRQRDRNPRKRPDPNDLREPGR